MSDTSIKRLERLTAITASVAILVLLIVRARHAGALWRDECGLVQLSQMPAMGDIVTNFPHEAFPPPFPILVRGWTNVFGTSDGAFRCFGATVGLLFIVITWMSVRLLDSGVPLLSLALIGLNTAFLTWGTSIRGYGLAATLIALTFGLTARLLIRPTPLVIAATAAAFVASAQCLVHNTVLLSTITLSAIAVCLVRRNLKHAVMVLAIGGMSFIAFLPYFRLYLSARDWDMTVRLSVPSSWLWAQFESAFGQPSPVMAWIWCGGIGLLMAAAIWRLYTKGPGKSGPETDILLYGIVTCVTAFLGYYLFLQVLRYYPQPWYFFGLLSIMGLALDLFVNHLSDIKTLRIARVAFTGVLIIIIPLGGWTAISQRQTNIDIVARALEKRAAPADLILVSPWQYGIPFNWYYHGKTPWITLPQLWDHRLHRYDLVKTKMTAADPIADLRDAISQTLRDGHLVWIVGEVRVPNDNRPVKSLSPAPDPNYGWDSLAYVESWMEQIGIFLRSHAAAARLISMPGSDAINEQENAPLVVARGWRD
jgi:hypothetical protein